jgi:hypothetical protein
MALLGRLFDPFDRVHGSVAAVKEEMQKYSSIPAAAAAGYNPYNHHHHHHDPTQLYMSFAEATMVEIVSSPAVCWLMLYSALQCTTVSHSPSSIHCAGA